MSNFKIKTLPSYKILYEQNFLFNNNLNHNICILNCGNGILESFVL